MEMINEETGEVTDDGTALAVQVEQVTALTVNRGEIEMQLDAAHRYPRSVRRFLSEAITLATLDEETAQSCMYTFKRGGKSITGPSIRCAEICISAWGNAHVGARIVGTEEKEVIAQGGCWDLEKNVRCTTEIRRRITGRDGQRFNDDMITVTGNAAASIALRNAIFKIVPRAYVQRVYDAARKAAIGSASTLSEKRAKVVEKLTKMGATQDRIVSAVGKAAVDDLTVDDVEALIGLGSAIKAGDQTVDGAFPEPKVVSAPPAEEVGRRVSMGLSKSQERRLNIQVERPSDTTPPEPGSQG